MKTLKELYVLQKDTGKFRFVDWSYRTKYLKVIGHDERKGVFHCILDNGEKVEIAEDSDFWKAYSPGDELRACAV